MIVLQEHFFFQTEGQNNFGNKISTCNKSIKASGLCYFLGVMLVSAFSKFILVLRRKQASESDILHIGT